MELGKNNGISSSFIEVNSFSPWNSIVNKPKAATGGGC